MLGGRVNARREASRHEGRLRGLESRYHTLQHTITQARRQSLRRPLG